MPTIIRQIKYLSLLLIIAALLLSACSTTIAQTSTSAPATPSQTANRVEVIYFHLPQRCVTCLCFEERLNYVIKTYFTGAVTSGKLIYNVVEIGKKENAAIVSKYDAYGSQLFVNVIINNKNNYKEIQEIWNWKCPTDNKGFDEKIKNLIEESLKSIS